MYAVGHLALGYLSRARFIKRLMTGKFNGTLVITMGCNGASDSWMTEEFINQGAIGYVGWTGAVVSFRQSNPVPYSSFVRRKAGVRRGG